MDANQVALALYRQLGARARDRRGHVIDQIDRAAESVVLNVAEAHHGCGPGRRSALLPTRREHPAT